MKIVRILHVASFTGNIGDNASHIGLYNILRNVLGNSFNIEQIEIRRFYKNYSLPDKMYFDDVFVKKANEKDLLIFGGGGFLDYWVPNSKTGTTIDITDRVLEKLKVPTLFVSVGCIPHQPVPDGNINKFYHFLKLLGQKENIRVAVRNDGSIHEINRLFGDEFDGNVTEILDNGFFFEPNTSFNYRLIDKPYIAINTTLDQLTMQNRMIGVIDYSTLKKELCKLFLNIIDNTDYSLVFVPHIFKDLQAFRELLEGVNDFHIRSRIAIAPYIQGDYGCKVLMSIYNQAESVLGMRFHANVCPLAMGKRIVGLAALDRVIHMYNSIGRGSDCISINDKFADVIYDKLMVKDDEDKSKKMLEIKSQTLDIYKRNLAELGILN